MFTAHKVMGKGHMYVEVEVKTSTPAFAAIGPAASHALKTRGVRVGGAIVGVRHGVGEIKLCVEGYFCVFV